MIAYDVPWVFIVSCMVYAICQIKWTLQRAEIGSSDGDDAFVMNESRMNIFLVMYLVYSLLFLASSIT